MSILHTHATLFFAITVPKLHHSSMHMCNTDLFENVKKIGILLTKTTNAQNEVALSYYKVRGLYFLAVTFTALL